MLLRKDGEPEWIRALVDGEPAAPSGSPVFPAEPPSGSPRRRTVPAEVEGAVPAEAEQALT